MDCTLDSLCGRFSPILAVDLYKCWHHRLQYATGTCLMYLAQPTIYNVWGWRLFIDCFSSLKYNWERASTLDMWNGWPLFFTTATPCPFEVFCFELTRTNVRNAAFLQILINLLSKDPGHAKQKSWIGSVCCMAPTYLDYWRFIEIIVLQACCNKRNVLFT